VSYRQLLPRIDPDVERAVLREVLENDFLLFVQYFFKIQNGTKFRLNDHHEQIAEALLRCHRHECKRLVINIPPRYSKTELAVVMFIAWCLAKNPACQFIHLSYSDELALDNSARILELIQLEEFQALWALRLKADRKSKSLWRTDEGGGLKAGAAGGAVTGFGAGVDDTQFGGAIIMDDALKPDDEEYEVIRRKTNRRINATVKSRCNSRSTPIVIIGQRLHDDDPPGFVLGGGTGEEWEHLKIPVLRKDGTPLWTFRQNIQDLVAIQVADKHVWNGQYMQEPIPDEGDFFTIDNARWYKTLPARETLNTYGSSDYAAEDKAGSDYTEHGIFSVDPAGNIYVTDWWSGQKKSDVWIEEQLDLVAKWKPLLWCGETGPIKSSIEPWLTKRMRERKTYVPLRWVPHNTKNYKVAGARGAQALWEAGRIYLPEGKEWAQDLLRQLTRFPLGTLDDKVDTLAIFCKLISKVWELSPPEPEKEPFVIADTALILEEYAPQAQSEEW